MNKESYEKWILENFLKTLKESYDMPYDKLEVLKETLMLEKLDKEKTMTPDEFLKLKNNKNE